VRDAQSITLSRKFTVAGIPLHATLFMTCDDGFEATLNGKTVLKGDNFQKVEKAGDIEQSLHQGENEISVACRNGTGPAGLVGWLQIRTDRGNEDVWTNNKWTFTEHTSANGSVSGSAAEISKIGEGVWGAAPQGWPGLNRASAFPIGEPMPAGAVVSNTLRINVIKPDIMAPPYRDPSHRIGMDWEPWFTPLNASWATAEAVPLIGYYPSLNKDVIRQHILWMNAIGVDFLLVDWSNNIWGATHWKEHPPGVDQLIESTTALMQTLAQMRTEGFPVPQVTLLLGLINGPPAKMSAVNEELQYVQDTYIAPPQYRDLWVTYQGKPLITVLDTQGPDFLADKPPIDSSHFTIRWMSTLLEHNKHAEAGFWSWMDGVIHPIVTRVGGGDEALTITPAFFGDGGWTYPAAMGRRGGATFVEQFRYAAEIRPTFLLINQWNEFAGQPKGEGNGPKHDQYVDTYNVELSDDIEPTSLTEEGYRGGTGWGFTYQNLTRALIRIYSGQDKKSVVLAAASPEQTISTPTLSVEWSAAGPAATFTVLLDGKPIQRHLASNHCTVSLKGIADGVHAVTIAAEGCTTRYEISAVHEDHDLKTAIPARVTLRFEYICLPSESTVK
jgi:hypothetical protein